MSDYPVDIDIDAPLKFERLQLIVRLVIAIVLALVGITAGWFALLLYLGLPAAAAIVIATRGQQFYAETFAPSLWRGLEWIVRFSAYMSIVVDRFPSYDEQAVTTAIRFTGTPTVASSLSRLVTSLPNAIVLAVVSAGSAVISIVTAALVVIGAPVPRMLCAFQRGAVRWQARFLAYHASLVAEYPPFELDTERRMPPTTSTTSTMLEA